MVATTKDQAREFARLLEQYEPEVRRAFMASVTDLSANVDWPSLLAALEAGDVQSAIAALHIDAAAFAEYSSAMTQAYAASGASTAAQIGLVGVRFNMSNPAAQDWIAKSVGERITGFVQEQVESARELIGAGYAEGKGPRQIGLDLVGRVVSGGKREGGILGMDIPRAERYRKVVEAMRTSEGVADLVTQRRDGSLALKYKVNKATEARILRAYRNGTAVPAADRAISERQYYNALLKARGDTIGRTETAGAVENAKFEQWYDMVQNGLVNAEDIQKTLIHSGGPTEHHRHTHREISGKPVQGLFTRFALSDGTSMNYSHDPEGGAINNINCRCLTLYRVVRRVN